MPGRLFLRRSVADLGALLGLDATAVEEVGPRNNIAPGQHILSLSQEGFSMMRWGMIPVGKVNARGRPVLEILVNARSETVFDKAVYEGTGRAVVPADGWYEWTGEARRKTAWSVQSKDGTPLFFAAITDVWQAPDGTSVSQVATVTCPPNADLMDIHHRMGVLLDQKDIEAWLTGSEAEVAPLMQPWPDGLLRVAKAEGVDWSAP